jgi:hypothetical protein
MLQSVKLFAKTINNVDQTLAIKKDDRSIKSDITTIGQNTMMLGPNGMLKL